MSISTIKILLRAICYSLVFSCLISACGGGGGGSSTAPVVPDDIPEDDPGTSTPVVSLSAKQGQALLGPIVNANVFVYDVENLNAAPLCSEITTDLSNEDGPGIIDLSSCPLEAATLYFVIVKGGDDIDADDDGELDETPTPKQGALRGIYTGEDLLAGGWRVNVLTEMAYNAVSDSLLSHIEIEELIIRLHQLSTQLINADLNDDGLIDYNDLTDFVPITDADKLNSESSELLDEFLQAILNGNQNDLVILAREYLLSSLQETRFEELSPNFYNYKILIDGDYLYAAGTIIIDINSPVKEDLRTLRIFDISDLNSITLVSSLDILEQLGTDLGNVFLEKNGNTLLFGISESGVFMVDVATPSTPSIISSYEQNASIVSMLATDDILFVSTFEPALLSSVDISNPEQPIELDSVAEIAFSMHVEAPYLYVYGQGLSTFNIENPENIFNLDQLVFPSGSGRDIAYQEGFIYVPSSEDGTQNIDIYNVADPFNISFNSRIKGAGFVNNLKLSDSSIYTKTGDTVTTYEIVSAGELRRIDSRASSGTNLELDTNNVYLYGADSLLIYAKNSLNSETRNLSILDTELAASEIEIVSNYAYVGDDTKLLVVDITNPEQGMAAIGELQLSGFIKDITIVGGIAYIANEVDGLTIIDVTDPSKPVWAANESTLNTSVQGVGYSTTSVVVANDFAYTGLPNLDTVAIFDVSDPSNPTPFHQLENISVRNLAIVGDLLVVQSIGGTTLFDVSDASNPLQLSEINQSFSAVHISNGFLYMSGLNAGLTIYNISDPDNPILTGSALGLGVGNAVTVQGNSAYIANEFGLIDIYDISEKTDPIFMAQIKVIGTVKDVAVNEDYIFSVNVFGITADRTVSAIGNLN